MLVDQKNLTRKQRQAQHKNSPNMRKLKFTLVKIIVVVSISLGFSACQPLIYDFTVTPFTAGAQDSIFIKYKVRGDATLVLHDDVLSGADSAKHLKEFTLVVRNHGKEISRKIQVVIINKGASDRIVFTTALHGNSIVAKGVKDTLRWGKEFVVNTVTNTSGRALDIRHAGKSLQLKNKQSPSAALAGSPVNGDWEFVSVLTAAEQADHSLLPDRLGITITVTHR
jgi:hypothetical protein